MPEWVDDDFLIFEPLLGDCPYFVEVAYFVVPLLGLKLLLELRDEPVMCPVFVLP